MQSDLILRWSFLNAIDLIGIGLEKILFPSLHSQIGNPKAEQHLVMGSVQKSAVAVIASPRVKVGLIRLADIYIFSCEGPVWIILLFKQLFICVHFYQLRQAEELL